MSWKNGWRTLREHLALQRRNQQRKVWFESLLPYRGILKPTLVFYHVVEANSINSCKSRLDKYLTNQDVIYNYDCDLTGTGGLPVCM